MVCSVLRYILHNVYTENKNTHWSQNLWNVHLLTAQLFSLSCMLCLFRQIQASNDASLLYHELSSLYGHIPRRCSSSSLTSHHIIKVIVPNHTLVFPSILHSKTVHRRDSLLNTWPNQFVCLCRMVFIKLLFSSTMSKTSWLDRCSVQLIFINLLQTHISNDSNLWMSTILNVHVLRHTIPCSKSQSLLFFSLTLPSSLLSVIIIIIIRFV